MIRQLIAAAAAACAISVAHSPAPKTDRDRAELKGPIKTVTTRWQANHKDAYGSVEERELGTSTYDASGSLLVEHEITPDFARDKVPERHGLNETLFRSRMGSVVERYRFDAASNMIERQTWYGERADGAPSMTERYKYDAAGRMSERELFQGDAGGKRFGVRLFTRDANGNVTIEEIRNADAAPPFPRMHYTYQLDGHGNWTAKLVTRENVAEDAHDYRYAGNLYRVITYHDKAPQQ